MKSYILLFCVFAVISCTALKGIDMSNISLGMKKSEVQENMSSFYTKTIGAKQYNDGKMEVLEVSERFKNGNGINDYWLYFFNDKLVYSEPINSVRWQAQDYNFKLDDIHNGLKNN